MNELVASELILLAIGSWKDTTAEELWGDGLDYGEDFAAGRKVHTIEEGNVLYVRVIGDDFVNLHSWKVGEDGYENRTLEIRINPYA